MHSETQLDRAVGSIARHLRDIPFLTFGEGQQALKLCYRKRGEEIHDPECMQEDEAVQALQAGVFRRYRTTRDGIEGWRWMRMCSLDTQELKFSLRETLLRMTHVEIESVPLDIGWQAHQWEEIRKNEERRERRAAAPRTRF